MVNFSSPRIGSFVLMQQSARSFSTTDNIELGLDFKASSEIERNLSILVDNKLNFMITVHL